MDYAITEVFTSIQGEGKFTGTAMTFIRLAGCSVGKLYTSEGRAAQIERSMAASSSLLPIYAEECTSWSGDKFACDTDFRVKERVELHELVSRVERGPKNVCITGGEPFIQNLEPLLAQLLLKGKIPHIETSGTRVMPKLASIVWLTVSPKSGYMVEALKRANEIKVLVDAATFSEPMFYQSFLLYFDKVWVQPVNGENSIDEVNLQFCIDLIGKYPELRLSMQAHKVWRVR